MSNVKTVLEKLNKFVFTFFICLLFTHRCETQEVEVKTPNLILSTQNFSSSIQIRGSSFLRNELLPNSKAVNLAIGKLEEDTMHSPSGTPAWHRWMFTNY